MKSLALVLRFGSAIFSLIAFSVIISNGEKRVAAGSTFCADSVLRSVDGDAAYAKFLKHLQQLQASFVHLAAPYEAFEEGSYRRQPQGCQHIIVLMNNDAINLYTQVLEKKYIELYYKLGGTSAPFSQTRHMTVHVQLKFDRLIALSASMACSPPPPGLWPRRPVFQLIVVLVRLQQDQSVLKCLHQHLFLSNGHHCRITVFDLNKVIESFVRHEETLPRELKRHLDSIEERLLESLAWAKGSSMYNSLIVAKPLLKSQVCQQKLLADPMPLLECFKSQHEGSIH
ncbi:hypothetical protein L7F22_041296 [Adiantum nelumboides]|nr:hypothetical protein [Adiantum nelumboides]